MCIAVWPAVAAVTLCFGILLAGASAGTTTQTFTAVADSYVSQKFPTANYGTKTALRVGDSPLQRAYVRFDVAGLTSSVGRATLRVYATSGSTVGISVRGVADNSWGERTISYNNAPQASSTVTASSGGFGAGQWLSFDVTPLVTENGLVSLALTGTSKTTISLASRESGSSSSPNLVLETAASQSPPSNDVLPTISGSAQVGQPLTAAAGSWSGTQPIAYAYQWRRCDPVGAACGDIAGATASSYTLTGADVGATIRVSVTASNSAGSSSASSAATALVQAAPQAPSNDLPPTISGSAQAGQPLTAAAGSWSGTQPIAYAYQWRRCDPVGAACGDIAGATASSYTLTGADVGATIRVSVTASNSAGSSSASSAETPIVIAVPVASDPVVMAAGDIACGVRTNGGDCRQLATSDLLVNANPDAVLALGDEQYQCGELTDFQSFYEQSWGRLKAKTYPAIGNHEYGSSNDPADPCFGLPSGAPGYFAYFGAAASPQDPGCALNCRGYYSFDLGTWHVIALNSNCWTVGGCGSGSPQEQWLRQDLASSMATCTLAYWHHPVFTSGSYSPGIAVALPLFQALYDFGADVVLTGHDHNYERFAPQDPAGALDLARGIREFVVGTGGRSLYAQGLPTANSERRNASTFGVLKLTLRSTGFDWQFVPVAGSTFTDSGTDTCDGTAPDILPPSPPANLAAATAGSRSVNLTWTATTDNVGVVAYEIYRDGSLLATTTGAGFTDNTVVPATSYSYAVKARDAAGNSSASSNAASVTTPEPNVVAFLPEADARVSEGSPTTNNGTSYLRVDGGIDPDVESNLRFSVTGVTGPLQSAKLRLYAYSSTVDGPSVYRTDDNWLELGVTWNTRPPRTSAASDDRGAIGTNAWVEWDVTPFVGGNGTYSFTLAGTSDDGVDFYSREASSFRPQLIVTYG